MHARASTHAMEARASTHEKTRIHARTRAICKHSPRTHVRHRPSAHVSDLRTRNPSDALPVTRYAGAYALCRTPGHPAPAALRVCRADGGFGFYLSALTVRAPADSDRSAGSPSTSRAPSASRPPYRHTGSRGPPPRRLRPRPCPFPSMTRSHASIWVKIEINIRAAMLEQSAQRRLNMRRCRVDSDRWHPGGAALKRLWINPRSCWLLPMSRVSGEYRGTSNPCSDRPRRLVFDSVYRASVEQWPGVLMLRTTPAPNNLWPSVGQSVPNRRLAGPC